MYVTNKAHLSLIIIHLVPQRFLIFIFYNFLHLNIFFFILFTINSYFISGLKHGNGVFLLIILIKSPMFIAENLSL